MQMELVRFKHASTTEQAPEHREDHVGQRPEEQQDQRPGRHGTARGFNQRNAQPGEDEADQVSARIAEEDPAEGKVEDHEANDSRAEDQGDDANGVGADLKADEAAPQRTHQAHAR